MRQAKKIAGVRADFVGFEVMAAPAGGREVEIIVDGALWVRLAPGYYVRGTMIRVAVGVADL